MGIVIAAVVLIYIAVAALVIKLMPSRRSKSFSAVLFLLVPFGDHLVGLAYFKYLCLKDAGEFVFKRVDNVAGFYIDRTPFRHWLDVQGFEYVEGLGAYKKGGRELVRLERDAVLGSIREKQVQQITARYSFDPDVNYVGKTFLWYFPYVYREARISDRKSGEKLAKQVRIYYSGGWIERFVFYGGGETCQGNSTGVSQFLVSVLHPNPSSN